MKKIKDYTFIERIYSLVSCLSFIIVLFIPDGSYLDINIIIVLFTSLLSHGSSLFLSQYKTLEYVCCKIDHFCILLLALNFLKFNTYINISLFTLSILNTKLKDIIILILYLITFFMIYKYDILLLVYILLIVLLSFYYYYQSLQEGWTFMNSWGWHLLSLHYFISIKILQLYIDNDKFK